MTSGVSLDLKELIGLRGAARGLELGARRRSLSVQAGGYRSAYRGRGLEFDEVRAYQSGDDSRTIDWRVTARRGKPYTKLYCEERERPVLLLVDQSPILRFGTRTQFKSVLGGRLAAVLAWAADRAGDRVGGVVSGGNGHREILPAPRQSGVLPLLNAIVKLQPQAPGAPERGRLDDALLRLLRVARPGSLVMILSDFREAGDMAGRHIRSLAQHNDIIGVFLSDPLEMTPPRAGAYKLGTPVRNLTVDTGDTKAVATWRAAFEAHRTEAVKLFTRSGGHCMDVSTADNPVSALRRGLAARSGAAGGR